MKVLVHVCCAPCYGYVHKTLESEGHEVVGLFYNPNIQPYQEYRKRLKEAQRYAYITGARMEFIDEYDIEDWLSGALAEKEASGDRCVHCYNLRLGRVARYGKENGFDCYTSTLLSSTHQDHECIKQVGEDRGKEAGIDFLYRDFRVGKKESYQISRERDLYRQGYCRCVFSEQERYLGD